MVVRGNFFLFLNVRVLYRFYIKGKTYFDRITYCTAECIHRTRIFVVTIILK